MQISLIIVIFLSSLLIAVTIYSVYSAFGPDSKYLIDPFEEHED
jgi:PsbN protein